MASATSTISSEPTETLGNSMPAEEAAAMTTPAATLAPVTKASDAEERPSLPPGPDESAILHGSKLAIVFAALLLTIFVVALDQSILATALPKVSSDFNSFDKQGWVAASFVLTQAGTILFWGQVLRIFCAKHIQLVGLLIFEVGSSICAGSQSIDVLIFGRAVAGLGAAALMCSLVQIMAQTTSLETRPKLFGAFGALFGLSSIIGPLLGGAIVDNTTWRWCFILNVPVGGISAVGVMFLLKASPPLGYTDKDRSARKLWRDALRLDFIGSTLFLGAITCLTLALNWGGNQKPWNDASVIVCLVLFGVIFLAFGLWLRFAGEKAVVPLSIFKSFSVYCILIFSFVARFVMFLSIYWLPVWFQATRHDSATDSGIRLLAFMLAVVFSIIIGGQLVSRIGYYWPFMIFGNCLAMIAGGLLYTIGPDTSSAALTGFQILLGVGVGLTMQNSNLAMQAEFNDTPRLIAQSSGLAMCAQFVGGTVGLSVAQAAFAGELTGNIAKYAPSAPFETLRIDPLAIYDLPAEVIPGAILAYTKSLNIVFVIIVPLAGVGLLSNLGIRNLCIKKKPAPGGATSSKASVGSKEADSKSTSPSLTAADSHADASEKV